MKKLTYKLVANFFKENNCELLEDEYKGVHSPMKYKCQCGKIAMINFSNFKMGKRCRSCGIKKYSSSRKFTYEEVYDYFLKKGCLLLDKEYKNCDFPMKYKCQCGKIAMINFSNFKVGKRCRSCGFNKTAAATRFTYEEVYDYFLKKGCLLLDKGYVNSKTLMGYVCCCGRKSKITYNNFKKGNRCKGCQPERMSAIKAFDYGFVKNVFEKNNCELLESEYINSRTPMKYRCECGEISVISFTSLKQGNRCHKCGFKKISESKKLSTAEIIADIESFGYKCIDNVGSINTSSEIKIMCPRGHTAEISIYKFRRGNRCKECGLENRSGSNHHFWYKDREEYKRISSFRRRCYSALHGALKAIGKGKCDKSKVLNGYSWKELKNYIESHPNWDKVKNKDWHLDHIYPLRAFMEYNLCDTKIIKIINGLDNLQPLTAADNLRKRDKYNEHEFKNWLKSKGIKF